MTVGELIEMVRDCDEDAEVRIMSQEGWPFENGISGVAVRSDFLSDDCECDHPFTEPHEEGCPAEDDFVPKGCSVNDVFIVEGGAGALWEQGGVGSVPALPSTACASPPNAGEEPGVPVSGRSLREREERNASVHEQLDAERNPLAKPNETAPPQRAMT